MPHAKVRGGLLDEPYPIQTRGDVSRARVLPQVRSAGERPTTKRSAPAPVSMPKESEQPKGGFDYVAKRNRMLKKISGRANGRSSMRRA